MKVVLVDDEPLALEILNSHCSKIPDIEVLATFQNTLDASTYLQDNHVDALFVDIQMPQLTGLDFVKTLVDPPAVVFTTAYSEYAVEGFELDATDYLLKPISFDRFVKAVNRLRALGESPDKVPPKEEDDYIFVKADKKLVKIHYDDIVYIEGLKDYVMIQMTNERVITLQTMKSLTEKLPSDIFLRVHRSYILNTDKIEALMGNMVEVTQKGQKKNIPIGKSYRDKVDEIIKDKRL